MSDKLLPVATALETLESRNHGGRPLLASSTSFRRRNATSSSSRSSQPRWFEHELDAVTALFEPATAEAAIA